MIRLNRYTKRKKNRIVDFIEIYKNTTIAYLKKKFNSNK